MRSSREVEGGNIDVWKLQHWIWNESIPTAVSTESVEPNGTGYDLLYIVEIQKQIHDEYKNKMKKLKIQK